MSQDSSVGWRRDLHASTVDASHAFEAAREVRVPGLTILCHPDPRRIGEVSALADLPAGRSVQISRLSPSFSAGGGGVRRPLADAHLSRSPAFLVPGRAPGSVRLSGESGGQQVDAGVDLPAEFSSEDLEDGCVLKLGERVALLLHFVDPTPAQGDDLGLVGASIAMTKLRDSLRRLARTDVPVLLRGETGTGKELAAAALHELSTRRRRPYVSVDMAAFPESLAASELFGAEKGAFTGADRQRAGYFQRADGGTLFLDEIGDAPQKVQTSLLRALETGEIQKVGADATRRVDVRVIAATDADLESKVREGSFRAPLLHRLEGASVSLPPLRERRSDIPRLLLHFLRGELLKCDALDRLAPAGKWDPPWLPADLMAVLVQRSWPGNVRQLRNVARQIVVHFFDRDVVVPDAEMLGRWGEGGIAGLAEAEASSARSRGVGRNTGRIRDRTPRPASTPEPLRQPSQLSADEVEGALAANDWRIQPAARALGISRTSLYALIDELPGVRRATQVDRAEIEEAIAATGGDLQAMVRCLKISRHGLQRRMRELGLP